MSLVKLVTTYKTMNHKGEVQLAITMVCRHFCLSFLTKICNDWLISFSYYYHYLKISFSEWQKLFFYCSPVFL